MKFSIALVCILGGCSCASLPSPIPVSMPVAVFCHAEALPEPQWSVPHLLANTSAPAELQAVLADLQMSKGYIEELQAELSACS